MGTRSTALSTEGEREQAAAFRLASHNLAERLPSGSHLEAAAVCGVQNTPPGMAAIALHARVAGLSPGDVERALVHDRTLLQAWSLRAAPHVFPSTDAAVFGYGLLPLDEATLRFFMRGAVAGLDKIGLAADRLVDLTAAALREALDARGMTKDQLGIELAARVAEELGPAQRAAWRSPSWIAPGQSIGESMVRFALPIVALRGQCCHGERRGHEALLVRTDQWRGALLPVTVDAARAELVRRYLHAYGPSTIERLAAWAGIAPAEAAEAWRLVEGELCEAAGAWLLRRDLPAFSSPPAARGARFLPPHDPYLQLRDRTALIADRAQQRRVWQSVGSPGVVLVGGQAVATWRSRKRGRRLTLSVEPFTCLAPGIRAEIEAEAAGLGPFWGCQAVQLSYAAG
jgi:hypothetical protein